MDAGRAVGRALLVALDVLVAGAIVGFVAVLVVPTGWVADRFLVALTVSGVGAGLTLAVAMGLAGLGRTPFPATRMARAVLDRALRRWP